MKIENRIVVVTGAASGIGRALAECFHDAGAAKVVCVDLNLDGAKQTAEAVQGVAYQVDVADGKAICALIDDVETNVGPIDLFCSNAGILTLGGAEVDDAAWQSIWDINVMAHIHVVRHLVPRMQERGEGYFLITASAAGLLSQIGSAPYSVTKHAAVGFAEWLAITYGDDGIGVSALCPQAVRSNMTQGFEDNVASIDGMLEPDAVAASCKKAIEEETFLVLPHPEVLDYMRLKTSDYDRWIGGMRKLNRRFQNN